MKHTWKKAAAGLLAMALVVGAAPANVGLGGFWRETAIVANAAGVSDAATFTSAVQSGGTITLDADIALTETLWLENNEDIVIDLNGHTLSTTENFAIYAPITVTIRDSVGNGKISGTTERSLFNIVYSGSLLLESGTLECKNCSEGRGGIAVGNSTAGKGSLIVNGGVIDSASHSIWLNNGNVTINGGTFIGDFIDETGDLTITGGTFSFDPSNFLDENYTANQNGNYWTVEKKGIAYDDVATIPGEVRDISGSPEATGENNTFDIKIGNYDDLPTLLYLTTADIEQGTNAWFGFDNSDGTLPSMPIQRKFQDMADEYGCSIGEYFDLTLNKKVGSNPSEKVEQTNGDIEVLLSVPESEDYKTAKSFGIIREHDETVEWIAVDYNDTTKEIKFKTDKFSTYALAYEESAAITSASVTLGDDLALNFYVDGIADAAGYTVMFDGACDENGTQVALTEKDGKFFATANVNAKDFKENIAATLYKDGVATDVTLTSSVDAYLTALLATDGLDDKTKAMVTSAQLYGLAADEYFNETDNNVAAKLTAYMTAANINDTALNMALTPYAPTFTSDDAKVSMVLNSKIKLRVYSDNGANENGFGKYSEAAGLTPLTLAQPQAIDGFTVSGYTWVYRVMNNTASEAKDVNMAKALFAYMSAAEALNAPAVPAATPVTAITLNKTATTIQAGQTETLSVSSVTPDDATDKTVTWSSDNEAVATVNATTGEVTAVALGTANITATANDGSGVTATCAVTVAPATITVTWNNDDITGTDTYGTSFTKDGVTITADEIYFPYKNFMNGGTFTTTLGNFTKIEVTTDIWDASGAGWSGSTWTGNASSVSFSDSIVGNGMGNTKFVFTIAPTN